MADVKKFELTIKNSIPVEGRKGWHPAITGKKLEEKKIDTALLREQIAQFLGLPFQNIEITEIG